jgi:hypothetical protein
VQNPPHSAGEYFNMCHARARNIIERAFGRLKGQWVILRSASYFPIKMQYRIIMACALLHNLILQKMARDPMESEEQSVVDSEMPKGEVGELEFIMGISEREIGLHLFLIDFGG